MDVRRCPREGRLGGSSAGRTRRRRRPTRRASRPPSTWGGRAGASGQQVHPAFLDVLGAPHAAVVGADERGEPRLVAEAREAEGDAGGRAAHVLGAPAVGVWTMSTRSSPMTTTGAVLRSRLGPPDTVGRERWSPGRGSRHLSLPSWRRGGGSTLAPGPARRLLVGDDRGCDDARAPRQPLLHGLDQEPRAVAARRARAGGRPRAHRPPREPR